MRVRWFLPLMSIVFIHSSVGAIEQPLPLPKSIEKFELQDQFDSKAELQSQTRWLLFAMDMDGYGIIKEVFPTSPKVASFEKEGFLVSDISKMPSLIAKMMAIPKMKKYNFRLVLDRKGEVTKDWPRQEKGLALIELKEFQVVGVKYLKDRKDLEEFLGSLP